MKAVRLTLFLILLVPGFLQSQPTDPAGNPAAVPITGIDILIATGGLLGIKKIIESRKNNK